MKRKKKIHSGVCITDERIVCVTGHIENKTLVLTDALEMKRSSSIDEDITKFIETQDPGYDYSDLSFCVDAPQEAE